jgi:hypothetical protein
MLVLLVSAAAPGGRFVRLESHRSGKRRWVMERPPENQELPMPLTSNGLLVSQRCLWIALKSNETNEADKSMIHRMEVRIVRYAERQGAWRDK